MGTGIHQIIDRQLKRWDMEARARREAEEQRPGRPPAVRPWVTISRSFGSGGGEVARRLAETLGYEIFDREILEVLMHEGRFRAAILESLDERDRSSLDLWVEGLVRGRMVDKQEFHRRLTGVLGAIALHGHAIIIGRGANFVLDGSRGLHTRIVAPFTQRAETISRLRGIPYGEAEKLVRQTDEDRAGYIRSYFHRDIEDPLGYDLILNTAAIGVETAVGLIERALRQKLGKVPHIQF
jgi:cytidylate kinase